jgi:hypothetical protein
MIMPGIRRLLVAGLLVAGLLAAGSAGLSLSASYPGPFRPDSTFCDTVLKPTPPVG